MRIAVLHGDDVDGDQRQEGNVERPVRVIAGPCDFEHFPGAELKRRGDKVGL